MNTVKLNRKTFADTSRNYIFCRPFADTICLMLIFLFVIIICGYGKSKPEKQHNLKSETKKIHEYIYTETVIEDFETTPYSDSSLKFMQRDGQCVLDQSDKYPAPVNNSKKYLGIKVYAKRGDAFRIEFAKPFEITKYCGSISMWVYGEKTAGELSIALQDTTGETHILHFGLAASNGWKKLSKTLGSKIKQNVDYIGSANSIKILYIQYRATNKTYPEWQYFYIDDITASVRDKYRDRDDW